MDSEEQKIKYVELGKAHNEINAQISIPEISQVVEILKNIENFEVDFTELQEIVKAIKSLKTTVNVTVPEIKIPEVKIPEIKIPDVHVVCSHANQEGFSDGYMIKEGLHKLYLAAVTFTITFSLASIMIIFLLSYFFVELGFLW